MSSASGIRAGKAYVELGTKDSKLIAGLRAAQGHLKSFGKNISIAGGSAAAAGGAVLGPMLAASNVFASSGDELSKAADKTGISVEALSELRHAASQSAVDFKQLGSAVNKQQRTLAEAANGNTTAAESFSNIGLKVEDLLALSPDQQFEAIADKISQIEDPAQRTAAAMDIFGKSGADLMPMMIGGAQGIEALRKEARDLGLQVSGKDAASATLLGDTWANVQTVLKDVVFEVGAALAPALISVMSAIIPLIVGVSKWISENRSLVVTVAGIAAGVVAAGSALVGLGGIFTALSMAIGAAISVGSTIMAIFAAVASPIGIAIVLIGGLTAAFLTWTEAGQAVVGWFGTEFGKLTSVVSDTVGGMFDAIKGGRLDLAAKIAWTGVKLAVATVLESLLGLVGTNMKDIIGLFVGLLRKVGQIQNEISKKAMDWYTSSTIKAAEQEYQAELQRINQKQAAGGLSAESADRLRKNAEFVRNDKIRYETQANQTEQNALDQASKDLENWDPTEQWAKNFDTGELRKELDGLNSEAKASAKSVEDAKLEVKAFSFQADEIDLASVETQISDGLAQASKGATVGTFSAASLAQNFGLGNIQNQMLEVQKKIEKNTAENKPLTAKR